MSWIEEVVRIARGHYEQTKRAFPLPLVLPALQAKGLDSSQFLQGRKLKSALEADGRAVLSVIQNPNNPLAWAVVPQDIVDEGGGHNLFPEATKRADQRQPTARYFPAFWAAFIKPLEAGHRRFLATNEKLVRFDDLITENPLPDKIEILRQDVVELDGEAEVPAYDIVHDKAQAWAQRNGIQLSRFVIQAKPSSLRGVSGDDWFIRILQLPDSDLARISIPLDVLKKVL